MSDRTHTLKITVNKEVTEHFKSTSNGKVVKEKEEVRGKNETVDIICTCGKTFDTEAQGIQHLSKARWNGGMNK